MKTRVTFDKVVAARDILRGMTEDDLDALSHEARCAWIDSLDATESKVLHAPVGWRYTLAMVSDVKRVLVKCQMTAGERLRLLEWLDIDGHGLNPAAVAAVQPADARGAEIISEARKLGFESVWPASGRRQPNFFDVIGSLGVFWKLAQLNPSLLDALDLCGFVKARQPIIIP